MGVEQTVSVGQRNSLASVLDLLLEKESPFEAYKAVADKYVARADFSAARQVYQACITRFPESVDGYRELGVIQERLEDFDGQVESYRRTLALSAEQPYWLYVTLARLLAKRGSKTEAIDLYRLGFERAGNEADGLSYAELARLLSEQGDVEAALASYQQAIELQPELEWVKFCIETLHYNQGVEQLMLGEIEAAERCFVHVDQVKSAWEVPIWFEQGGKLWPEYQFDDADKFEMLKPFNIAWPKISIVTPSFNQGHFIEETILSVLNQGYENVEYIVIDGGSMDTTLRILERYQSQISITVLEDDSGQSNAINKGFRLATGELCGWLNSDDMLVPSALYQVALAYLESKCDVIAGICVTHRDKDADMLRKPRVRQANFTAEALADLKRWETGDFFFQPEAFFTRQIWEKCGGELNENLYYSMDHDLWMRFAEAGARLQVLNWPLALFRKHDAQKTSNMQNAYEELMSIVDVYHETNEPVLTVETSPSSILELNSSSEMNAPEINILPGIQVERTMEFVGYIDVINSLFESEQWEDMLLACQQTISAHPDVAEGYRWLGVVQEKLGDNKAQLVSYQQAITLDCDQPIWLYVVAGRLLCDQGHWNESIRLLKQALDMYPTSAEASRWLGFCQERIGDREGQLVSYQRAIELDANQPIWVYTVLIRLLRRQQRLGESVAIAHAADVQFDGSSSDEKAFVYYELAKAYSDSGELSSAIEAYRSALALKPGLSEAQEELSFALANLNLQERAENALMEETLSSQVDAVDLVVVDSISSTPITEGSISSAPIVGEDVYSEELKELHEMPKSYSPDYSLREENDLLLLQLHQLQEELEKTFLNERKLERMLRSPDEIS